MSTRNSKVNLLWISMRAPYDRINHAGGKTHNFYLKEFAKDERYDITLLSSCSEKEVKIVSSECKSCGITFIPMINYSSGLKRYLRKILNLETIKNPCNRYAGLTMNSLELMTKNKLRELKKNGYYPDVIFLEWTQVCLMIDYVKRTYPDSKIVEIEEDVAFLGYERHVANETNIRKKRLWGKKANKLRRIELTALNKADLVVVNNTKDRTLLESNNVYTKIFMWSPYFENLSHIDRSNPEKMKVIFYGAMNREENWMSAIWFIEKVMPLLSDIDFYVVGAHPNERLKAYQSDKVHVLGYVESLDEIFKSATCLVAPLVLGAGIKVKILEAFSAGIPVLTNRIGIEGIPAQDGVDYIHCEEAEDYACAIRDIVNKTIDVKNISRNERNFINRSFNYFKDSQRLQDIAVNL